MAKEKRIDIVLAETSNILRIGNTDRKILKLLINARRKLSVTEIMTRVKKSERMVRERLKELSDMGLVRREIHFTRKGKRAHLYFVLHLKDLVESIRKEVLRRLSKLKKGI